MNAERITQTIYKAALIPTILFASAAIVGTHTHHYGTRATLNEGYVIAYLGNFDASLTDQSCRVIGIETRPALALFAGDC